MSDGWFPSLPGHQVLCGLSLPEAGVSSENAPPEPDCRPSGRYALRPARPLFAGQHWNWDPYPILNIGLNDICYGRWTDCIAVRQLGMSKHSPLFLVQLKQYLATFQYCFAGLLISDCFLQGCPLFLTQLYDICLWSSHSRHLRSLLLYHGMARFGTLISLDLIKLVH